MTVMNAAQWADFKAFLDACNDPSHTPAPAKEVTMQKPVYVPSAVVFQALNPGQKAGEIAAPITPASDHHVARTDSRGESRGDIARLMRERVSVCG